MSKDTLLAQLGTPSSRERCRRVATQPGLEAMVSLRKQPSVDRSKIAMDRKDEVKYWIKHFRISSDDLQRTVEKVGNSASAVRKELRNSTLVKVTRTPDG
jgi:hypothetical protein